MRLVMPASTLPGPHSTRRVAPWAIMSRTVGTSTFSVDSSITRLECTVTTFPGYMPGSPVPAGLYGVTMRYFGRCSSAPKPSAALAAVIGNAAVPRTEVVSKLWTYIKKHGLQDKVNKRNINADDKLKTVFGKAQVTMFELAGLIGKHLK